ncbi:hypothetical protein [uncultured Gemella sp.]|jgi:hypothetical protein|uniref:hypothetical protein n=1 Tax=uncultured Gemella sp. TaxID=254352 RepID=UPI00204F7FA6|nr:hypothetical protein [uncultured Gemella sp.]DAS93018.1 MAG TPA: hypothetical protein [Caudoviricetes sp.]
MENNQLQPIHLIAQELSEKTIELANYKIAYDNLSTEHKKIQDLINNNEELKELVEKLSNKGE